MHGSATAVWTRYAVSFITPVLALLLCAPGADAQAYDPGSGRTPAILLAVPENGVAYYEIKERARGLVRAETAAEAEPLVERLVREYPRDGENWLLLATTKRFLKKHAAAAAAYERAAAIRGGYRRWFYAAASHLAAGNRQAALARVRDQMHEEQGAALDFYEAAEFASLKADPEFLALIGQLDPAGWSRNEGWARDLEYLHGEIRRVNPDYRDRPLPAEFTRRYEELKRAIPRLSDEQVLVEMNRMLHVLRQGHTDFTFITPGSRPAFRVLPLQVYFFPDGVFIVNAAEEHADLVGARVIAIGGTPVEEAWRRMTETRSVDGDMEYLWQTAPSLVTTPLLKGLGITGSSDSVELTIQPPDGRTRTVVIAARTSAPQFPVRKGPTAPLNAGRDDEKHWERAVPERNALYVRFSGVGNDPDETLPAFGQRLWRVITETKPRSLVLDMRVNRGGASSLYPELLRTVIAFSRAEGNQLYVLIGRSTYSAAGNFITELERLANPIFVGEASSDCCNLHGDPIYVVLPFSKVEGVLTALEWNLSNPWDRRREISPEVPVQVTARDYFAGRDPVLEAVYRMIGQRGTPSAARP